MASCVLAFHARSAGQEQGAVSFRNLQKDLAFMGSGETQRKVVIKNLLGLHARPAAMFVQIASKYADSEITVEKGDEVVNGKSIMGMMMLAAGMGTELNISACNGSHEEAVQRLCELIENKFGEE